MRLRRSLYILIVAVFPAILTLQNPYLRETVRAISFSILKPVLVASESIASAFFDLRSMAVHFWNAFQDQGVLERRVAELESKLTQYEEAVRENERLKKLLEFKTSLTHKAVAARVIASDVSVLRQTIVVDKGAKAGLKKDMPVIVAQGLVGRIMEIGPRTARVLLLIDPDARVSAVTDQTRSQGVVTGDGSSRLQMRYLSLDTDVSVGETVVTAGIGEIFPKGLRIGSIEAVERDADGLHLQAQIKPFVSFTQMEEVLCLASYREG